MPGRIITLQRQVRELGRLRAGLTVPSDKPGGRARPSSSKTWIATSLNRTYIEAAAEVWGGQAEEWQPLGNRPKEWRVITDRPVIDAILPPGDPLSQHYEMWSAGGCQRRCDGEREQRADKPCLCRAEFGDDFHTQPVERRCRIHTRLSVFLPELPDIGIWRVETHGYWPSVHITGYVETIKALVGEKVMVPVTMGIDPKSKVADGKTSHYVEIVVALKDRASFGQILASPQALAIGGPTDARTIEAGPGRAAIGAAPADERTKLDFDAAARAATDVAAVQQLWKEAVAAGAMDEQLAERFKRYAADLAAPAAEPDGGHDWADEFALAADLEALRALQVEAGGAGALTKPQRDAFWARTRELQGRAEPAAEAEVEPDRDAMWTQILTIAGQRGWSAAETSRQMREAVGKDPVDADGWAFAQFLDVLKAEQVPA